MLRMDCTRELTQAVIKANIRRLVGLLRSKCFRKSMLSGRNAIYACPCILVSSFWCQVSYLPVSGFSPGAPPSSRLLVSISRTSLCNMPFRAEC